MKKFNNILALLILTIAFVSLTISATFASAVSFKVDLGEFTEEIDSEELKGYDHVRFEVDGIYTYHVGEFDSYMQALKVSNEFYHRGYDQSEVVAFFNRVSIPLEDAFTLMDNRNVEEAELYGETLAFEVEEFNDNLDRVTVDSEMESIYYTVQIGAFSNEKEDEIFEIEGVIVEHELGDLFTYSCGEYSSYEEALDACVNIKFAGIKDAFVTAYQNGVRLELDPNSFSE